jgi:hypothetical protein
MRMLTALSAAAAMTLFLSACSSLSADTGCSYTADRSATVPLAGSNLIRIDAGAGSLRIEGKAGLTEVQVNGTACAFSNATLNGIQLVAEQSGSEVRVEARVPGGTGTRRLDLVIAVPEHIPLRITDSSGDTEIQNVGPVDVRDASGELRVSGVSDNLTVDDSSGSLIVENVAGNARIRDDSGDIAAAGISGDLVVSDSSGSIAVDGVGGDFWVESDGSGSIGYSNVKGRVVIGQSTWRP